MNDQSLVNYSAPVGLRSIAKGTSTKDITTTVPHVLVVVVGLEFIVALHIDDD